MNNVKRPTRSFTSFEDDARGTLVYNAAPRRISAKKREANADAESRAASLKMTTWGGYAGE